MMAIVENVRERESERERERKRKKDINIVQTKFKCQKETIITQNKYLKEKPTNYRGNTMSN